MSNLAQHNNIDGYDITNSSSRSTVVISFMRIRLSVFMDPRSTAAKFHLPILPKAVWVLSSPSVISGKDPAFDPQADAL